MEGNGDRRRALRLASSFAFGISTSCREASKFARIRGEQLAVRVRELDADELY
ncbi:hypothetical protein DAEQUDRAFT_721232 [Daedalea quercina L-15889]|uniref:Uncharacterized protein n=1 Tax=Daedalea quercina L-15889 TaxID=1314783 RepID=A0A165TQ24_9APHY|nr:hypothetical protein DAEQUDRAFT_721232 [Daedalea quercina L-15889]